MLLNVLTTLSRTLDPNDPEPCRHCGHCCRYVTVKLDSPRARTDYDEIRWFLLHENVCVFVDTDGWFVEFHTVCRKLEEWRCGDYAGRPQVCSDYAVDNCERYGEGDAHLHYFRSEQEYLNYLKKHRPRAYEWVLNPRPAESRLKSKPRPAGNGSSGKSVSTPRGAPRAPAPRRDSRNGRTRNVTRVRREPVAV